MLPAARQQKILGWLIQERHLSTADLQKRLNISPMTVWRDLKILAEGGLVQRVHGGVEFVHQEIGDTGDGAAVAILSTQGLPKPIVDVRKQAIGCFAAREILKPGDDIILEGGTSVASIIPYIDQPNITMLTNGLNTLALAQVTGTIENVLFCGGLLNQNNECFIGPQAERFFYSYHVDKVFVSAYAYIAGDGFFDPNPLYDSMKRTLCSRSQKTILLLDSNKLARTGFTKVLDFNDVDIMVTDWEAPAEIVEEIRSEGVDVRVAPKL